MRGRRSLDKEVEQVAYKMMNQKVGENIKKFRLFHKLSLCEVADKIGVSFQQLQKYECGKNGLSAYRMFLMAEVLHRQANDFFDGVGNLMKSEEDEGKRLSL